MIQNKIKKKLHKIKTTKDKTKKYHTFHYIKRKDIKTKLNKFVFLKATYFIFFQSDSDDDKCSHPWIRIGKGCYLLQSERVSADEGFVSKYALDAVYYIYIYHFDIRQMFFLLCNS